MKPFKTKPQQKKPRRRFKGIVETKIKERNLYYPNTNTIIDKRPAHTSLSTDKLFSGTFFVRVNSESSFTHRFRSNKRQPSRNCRSLLA